MEPLISVLLVEDDKDDQEFFVEALNQIENVTLFDIASNGREAIDLLHQATEPPSIIFMDINMPVMTGPQCLMEMAKHPEMRDIPVVMLSTSTMQIEELLKLGAKSYVKKTINNEVLRVNLQKFAGLGFRSGE